MRAKLGLRVFALFAAFAFAAGEVAAQQGTLAGRVTDADTGQPITGAQIEVLGAAVGGRNAGGLSNASGQFSIPVPPGRYAVVISVLGYETLRREGIEIPAGGTARMDVQLTSTALALNPIVVTASRREERKTDAPATTVVIGETQIQERPVTTVAEHLRSAPGADIITSGVQSTNVVLRGFNNIFSGALHALTDNRIAGIPSLRVNLLHFIPANNEDIERMEVVLGPGSALYGPNTANGVLHIITKSPIDNPGTTVTLGGGERSVFMSSLRTAHRISDNFGFKISGQYVRGDEWEFTDPTEAAARAAAQADPGRFLADLQARGLSAAQADLALQRVGVRDFDFERYGLEARADWRFDDGQFVAQYGRTSATGIELTGLGAGQTDDWVYQYFQGRFSYKRLFAQAYLNTSDAGNTFLLRDGVPLVDESRLFVTQIQHGGSLWDGRQDFTYGFDYFRTEPRTKGTINGINEDDDIVNEYGAYIQSETQLSDQFKLVLAGRWDSHSELDDDVWSPRAALVFSPVENQSFRFTYNRAFSTPTTLNFFLDISGGFAPDPLGGLGYRLRAQGPNKGFSFRNPDGSLTGMRSPFNPASTGGPAQLLPADVSVMWQLAVGVLQAQGQIDAATAALLGSLTPTAADIGINVLDPGSGAVTPLPLATIPDVEKLKESTTTTFELGYQGVIGNRVQLAADVWYMKREDFISPLVVRTPLLLLNATPAAGPDIGSYLVPRLMAAGMPQPVAEATAAQLAAGIGQIPLGVVSSADVDASAADILVTYVNAGTVDLWGGDLALTAFLNDRWSVNGSASFTTENYFADAVAAQRFGLEEKVENGVAPIALNAPKSKFTLGLAYRDPRAGFNAEARFRFTGEFPAESAGFVGTACVTGGQGGVFEEDCVDSASLLDLTLGYRVPNTSATIQVSVNNVFDDGYRSFVGVPEIGRFAMVKVKYDLF